MITEDWNHGRLTDVDVLGRSLCHVVQDFNVFYGQMMERNEGGKKLRRLMTTQGALVETFSFLHNIFICFPSDGTFCSSLIPLFFSPPPTHIPHRSFFVLFLDPSFLRYSLNGLFFYTVENHNNQPILPFVLVHNRGKKADLRGCISNLNILRIFLQVRMSTKRSTTLI